MPEPGRDVLAHPDRVGVVESERPAHPDAALGQGRAQLGLAADLLAGQDLAGDRAGVFGIEVELVGLEGVEEHLRAAQLAAVGRVDARVREHLAGDLAQDHRLGERLRADPDGRVRRLADQGQRDEQGSSRSSRGLLGDEPLDLSLGAARTG